MASRTFLLLASDYKKLGFVHENVGTSKIKNVLWRTQEAHIQPILGSQLYKKLLADISTGSITGIYKTLMDEYVVHAMVAYADYVAVIPMNVKIRNKQVGRGIDANQTANTDSEDQNIKDELFQYAVHYRNRLIGFLCENEEQIPEYEASDDLSEMNPEKDFDGSESHSYVFT